MFGGPIDFVKANAVYYAPYQKGDLLYVRETFNSDWCDHTIYKADGGSAKAVGYAKGPKWRPSIHMPKEAARIFLRVTGVRVERLYDITEEQAISEGFNSDMQICGQNSTPAGGAKQAFMWTWQRLYDNDIKCCWVANPWVWVIEFERCTKEGVPYVK